MKRKIENKLLIAMSVLLAILTVVIGILALNVIALKKMQISPVPGKRRREIQKLRFIFLRCIMRQVV